ncbi:MAG: hypothetical protein LBE59_03955 [Nevskiaceae bacterium]|nr:hypothetical protein [Nevskiaceae bacterium]
MRLLAVGAVLALLAACSGGAPTMVNPVTAPPTAASYSGPPPRDADVQRFFGSDLWITLKNRCGNCHGAGSADGGFASNGDVNAAYDALLRLIDREQPDRSLLVARVVDGHNCWLTSVIDCGEILEAGIRALVGGGAVAQATLRQQLTQGTPPPDRAVGDRRSPPAIATETGNNGASFANTIYPVLHDFGGCVDCHAPTSPPAVRRAPYMASNDVNEAFAAALSLFSLDEPASSRLVSRLRDAHNCWTASCEADANTMLNAITALAGGIEPTQLPAAMVVSTALSLYEGMVASGGSRDDTSTIAKYEFKTMSGATVFDTSGVEPALNLTMSGDVQWVGGWGIDVKTGGKVQGTTTASKKLADRIKATGEFSIEVWAAPADVTQEDAYLVSYSGGVAARNATVAQRAGQYEAMVRSSSTGANGAPSLLSPNLAQASLQHVVLTYDPVNGRRLYVNGNAAGNADPREGGTLSDWDDTFALVLGNETSGNRQWQGVLRFVAVHDHALTLEQIQQNFAASVGERYFLLFNVSELTGVPQGYILFQGQQYDSYSYLFDKPVFISMDPSVTPGSVPIEGMRIGLNGGEPATGQAYAALRTALSGDQYDVDSGQLLSEIGTVIGLQKGPAADEFFLSFERIGDKQNVRTEAVPVTPTPADVAGQPDIGVRTFEQINQTLSRITGVATTTPAVRTTYLQLQQQLPAIPDIQAFLASHQTAIAQMAIKYCSVMVDTPATRDQFFPGLNVSAGAAAQFATQAGKDILIQPLLQKAIGTGLATQPTDAQVSAELAALIDKLSSKPNANSATVAKAACAAVLGSGTTLIN